MLEILKQAHNVVWVGSGSEISNLKLHRIVSALSIVDQQSDNPILNRVMIAYNKFSNKTCKALENIGLKTLGGNPRYEHASTSMVLSRISQNEMFDNI